MNAAFRLWCCCLLLVLGSPLLSGIGGSSIDVRAQPAQTAVARPGIDVQHYDFHLALSDTTDWIEGTATIRLHVTTDTLSAVRLDLIGPPSGIRGTGMQVSQVTEEGETVSYDHENNLLRLRPGELDAGQIRTFVISYAGVPSDGLIIGTNRHGDRTFFGDNWPNRARHWLPVVDHLSDKATVEFRVQAPSTYEVVSNGELVTDSTAEGQRVTRWRTEVPLPPKVMVIGGADFVVDTVSTVDGVPVQSWVYPPDREAGFEDLGQAPEVLRFFEEILGPYPYEKLANVQSTTRYGGMENAAAIFYSEEAVADGEDDETLIAHEIAHQWFGNTVTEADWPHLWLSEGFATYLTALYLEHAYGPDRFRAYMQDARQQVVQFHSQNPTVPVVDTTYADPTELLNENSYQKGAWILHMLRHEIGKDTFIRGLQTYYDRYRNQNASTRDFHTVMEDVSDQDLDWFFDQWTRRSGHPVIDGQWHYDADAGECVVSLRQTQQQEAFRVPVEVAVNAGQGQTATLVLRDRRGSVRFNCSQAPSSVILDPDMNLLAETSMERAE